MLKKIYIYILNACINNFDVRTLNVVFFQMDAENVEQFCVVPDFLNVTCSLGDVALCDEVYTSLTDPD